MIAAVVEQPGRSREGCGSLCLISNTTTGSFYMLPCSISPSVPSTSRAGEWSFAVVALWGRLEEVSN